MRILFGVLGLLLTLAIIGSLAKTQLRALGLTTPASSAPQTTDGVPPVVREPTRPPQQQVQQDVDRALQQGVERNKAADQ